MKYTIEGVYPVLRCFLDEGEKIITSSGNMSWMSEDIDYKVHSGGMRKSFGRAFTGEGFFQNIYTAKSNDQEIAFATSMPGVIEAYVLDGNKSFIAQKNSFLASEDTITFETVFTKSLVLGSLEVKDSFYKNLVVGVICF